MLGQLCGDALGSFVEFSSAQEIRDLYPNGVRHMTDGGVWNTIAGQPTDDSEMALALARSLADCGTYDEADVRDAYVRWLNSDPFDIGSSVRAGLQGCPLEETQANGALMRVSPLGIFGAGSDQVQLASWAERDAALTHPHKICRQVNVLYVLGIAHVIEHGCDGLGLYEYVCERAAQIDAEAAVRTTIERAALSPPSDFTTNKGWVLIAFQNALWQVIHAQDIEEGVVASIMHGGDTDTNAAIAGAMLGAVHGVGGIPTEWRRSIRACRPVVGDERVRRPRPKCYWPCDADEVALQLLG